MIKEVRTAIYLGIGILIGGFASAYAESASSWYAGKQITFIAPTTAGGGYDLYSRLFVETFRKYIPGDPVIIVENMPGAGGMRSASYLFNVAPKDGTTIGMPLATVPISEALEPNEARYRSAQFGWIGTITSETDVLGVWKTTGVANLNDARKKEVSIGATGKTGALALNVYLANALLGTKFKVVLGYPSGNEVNMAMDAGEIQGRTNQWTSWNNQRPDWIKDGRINFLLQIGPPEAELPHVPVFLDLVSTPKAQAMVRLLQTNQLLGRSIYAPPGIPSDRLATLRDAFDKTVHDADFMQKLKTAGLYLKPLTGAMIGEEIGQAMENVGEATQDIKAAAKL